MNRLNDLILNNIKEKQFVDSFKKALIVEEYNYFKAHAEHYTMKIDKNNELEGRNFKTFYRIKGDCFDGLKQELINNPNSQYVTYFNDLAQDGMTPENISVLVKRISINNAVREVLVSQILNAVQVPTCANISFFETYKECPTRILGSVDFISADEKFVSLSDFNGEHKDFKHSDKMINGVIKIFEKNKITKLNPELKNKLIEQFIYSYLMRKLVLGDMDFNPWNTGLLINKKQKNIKLINFDYENSFCQTQLGECEFALGYVNKNFPELYEKFVVIIEKMLNALKETLPTIEDDYIKRQLAVLKDNIGAIISTADLIDSKVK